MRAGVVVGPQELGAECLRDLAQLRLLLDQLAAHVDRALAQWKRPGVGLVRRGHDLVAGRQELDVRLDALLLLLVVGLVEGVLEGRAGRVVGVEVRDLAVGVGDCDGVGEELVERCVWLLNGVVFAA